MTKRILLCVLLFSILISTAGAIPNNTSKKINGNDSLLKSNNQASIITANESGSKGGPKENSDLSSAQPLKIVTYGFRQTTDFSRFGFILENSNKTNSYHQSDYQVAALDSSGRVLGVADNTIQILFPGERIGIAGNLNVPRDSRIDHIQSRLLLENLYSLKLPGIPYQ